MSYSPLQARDRHGRWAARGGNAAFSIGKAAVGAGKKASKPRPVKKATGNSRNSGVIPYVRANKRSQTVGFNAGTKVSRHHRVVVGSYLRVESTRRHTAADKIAGKAVGKVFPKGTRRGRTVGYLRKNLSVNNPALRGTTPKGNQVRLGTSRGAGPTVIVRRGRHKTSQAKSVAGVKKYNNRIAAVKGKRIGAKKGRPARRKQAKRRR